MKPQDQEQLNYIIVTHTICSIHFISTMSILFLYIESLPTHKSNLQASEQDLKQLLQLLHCIKVQFQRRARDSQFIQCRNIIDRQTLNGISAIKTKFHNELQTAKAITIANQLSNCFNGFIHTLQFLRKLPIGNSQASYEIPSSQWQVLLKVQQEMNINWRHQLNKLAVTVADIGSNGNFPNEILSQFKTGVVDKMCEDNLNNLVNIFLSNSF
ncbi:HBR361Cp [Eremothecium sinecaudum]|uniref:HBR361Cp n=1 Tax=Eremothecium sinecaudum TaxID=45286 RepID=A0A120K1D4_9SACH|nr:HBR361Cp [Eremothecium sinecaudum]AMD19262.1 HBR361Cp [Eremothecium sinecaudum]